MGTLEINRLYSDGEVLSETELDAIKSSLEAFFNSTKVNDDNIQNAGITASSKLTNLSVSTAKFANESVTKDKIVNSAITTAKIANETILNENINDSAITEPKLATLLGRTPVGGIILFHTFGSVASSVNAVDIPRGYMICNGDRVTETNYNAIHGAGAWSADNVAASALALIDSGNGAYTPNFTDRYPVGTTDTTQTGTSAITAVGVSGSEADLRHTHTIDSHTHVTPSSTPPAESTAGVTAFFGVRQATTTGAQTSSTLNALTETEDMRPDSIEFLFLIRVV